MELFLQMKSPGAPVVKGGEKDSRSLSLAWEYRFCILSSHLRTAAEQHRGAGAPEVVSSQLGQANPTCYHHANPKIKGTSAEQMPPTTHIHWAVALQPGIVC